MTNITEKPVVVKTATHSRLKKFCDDNGFKYIFIATKAIEKYITDWEAKYSSGQEL